jgi:hypothetical protein
MISPTLKVGVLGLPLFLLSWFSINMLADRAVRAKKSKRRWWEEY